MKHFESHREMQAAAGITPLFRGPHEDDPQKVCIVMQIEDDTKLEAFMAENEASIVESGHLLETTERQKASNKDSHSILRLCAFDFRIKYLRF